MRISCIKSEVQLRGPNFLHNINWKHWQKVTSPPLGEFTGKRILTINSSSAQNPLNHVPMHVREAVVAALESVGEFLMVQAQ